MPTASRVREVGFPLPDGVGDNRRRFGVAAERVGSLTGRFSLASGMLEGWRGSGVQHLACGAPTGIRIPK